MNSSRGLIVSVLVALLALVCVPASVAKATQVSFLAPPGTVFQGQRTTLKAVVSPANASCQLTIKYKGGRLQRLQKKSAVGGRVSWTVRIPAVPAGAATATIGCAPNGMARTSLDVQWALQAPKVTIARSGFSQRPSVRRRQRCQLWPRGAQRARPVRCHRRHAPRQPGRRHEPRPRNRLRADTAPAGELGLLRRRPDEDSHSGGGFADRGRRQRVFRSEARLDAAADQRSDHRALAIRAISSVRCGDSC